MVEVRMNAGLDHGGPAERGVVRSDRGRPLPYHIAMQRVIAVIQSRAQEKPRTWAGALRIANRSYRAARIQWARESRDPGEL
jgi:hypothetical protein